MKYLGLSLRIFIGRERNVLKKLVKILFFSRIIRFVELIIFVWGGKNFYELGLYLGWEKKVIEWIVLYG